MHADQRARSPQDRSVIVPPGDSDEDRELAACAIISPSRTLSAARPFYIDVKSRIGLLATISGPTGFHH